MHYLEHIYTEKTANVKSCLAGCAGTCLASQHMGGGNRRSGVHVWSWLYSDAEVNLCSGVNLTISTQANPIAATHHTEWGTGHSTIESWEHRAGSFWQWHTLVISGLGRPGQLDSWGLLARQPSQLEFQAQTDRQTDTEWTTSKEWQPRSPPLASQMHLNLQTHTKKKKRNKQIPSSRQSQNNNKNSWLYVKFKFQTLHWVSCICSGHAL